MAGTLGVAEEPQTLKSLKTLWINISLLQMNPATGFHVFLNPVLVTILAMEVSMRFSGAEPLEHWDTPIQTYITPILRFSKWKKYLS